MIDDSADDDATRRQENLARFLEQVRHDRANPWWRPGAMRPEERERLVRIGLAIVLGDRADQVFVQRRADDMIEVGEDGHSFGFPIDVVLGDDPRTVLAHDVEWLVDELCEFSVAWAERLPRCPLHPDSHPLEITVSEALITASCPASGDVIRSASY